MTTLTLLPDPTDPLEHETAEAALHRLADFAFFEREGGVGGGRIDDAGFGLQAEIDVGGVEVALFHEVGERQARANALTRGLRLVEIREHDLLHLPAFRSSRPRR